MQMSIHYWFYMVFLISSDGIDQRSCRLSLGVDDNLRRLLRAPLKLSCLRLLAFELFYLDALLVLGHRLFTEGESVGSR